MSDDSVSLKEYLESRINGVEKATTVAAASMEKRLESMNEFRSQLKDQTATFLTKEYYEMNHKVVQDQVDVLRLSKAELAGKASQSSVTVAFIISAIGIIFSIISLVKDFIK